MIIRNKALIFPLRTVVLFAFERMHSHFNAMENAKRWMKTARIQIAAIAARDEKDQIGNLLPELKTARKKMGGAGMLGRKRGKSC